ncbi:MAG: hypothetical protein AAFY60_01270, partial [Myxococcota bacterium]
PTGDEDPRRRFSSANKRNTNRPTLTGLSGASTGRGGWAYKLALSGEKDFTAVVLDDANPSGFATDGLG